MNELLEKQTIDEAPRPVGRHTERDKEDPASADERVSVEAIAAVTYSKVERLEQRVDCLW